MLSFFFQCKKKHEYTPFYIQIITLLGWITESLCRVCGRSVVSRSVKTKYRYEDYQDDLHTVFGVETHLDNPHIHPQYFCHACKTIVVKTPSQPFQHLTIPYTGWCDHMDDSCDVCTHQNTIKRGGRPKKTKRTPGRPPNISTKYCTEHIRGIATPPLTHHGDEVNICSIHQAALTSELQCSLCNNILCSPVELVTCGSVVCAECLCNKIREQSSLECPCCHGSHLEDFTNTIRSW